MYRFFKTQSLRNVPGYSSEASMIQSTKMKLCSYCRVYHITTPKLISYTQQRNQTTTALLPLLRKTKQRSKKFAELSEVADGTIINRKATIRKMNPTQLSLFVNKSDIPTDELYNINGAKLLEFKKNDSSISNFSSDMTRLSYHQHTPDVGAYIVERSHGEGMMKKIDQDTVMEDLKTSGIADTASLIKNTSLLDSISKDEDGHEDLEDETIMTTKSVEDSRKGATNSVEHNTKVDPIEIERLQCIQNEARKESLTRTLNAYLQVCVSCGMMGRAYHTVMHYRGNRAGSKKHQVINDIRLYNTLLEAYARTGNVEKFREIMKLIDKDKVEPNAKTYATIFECYGNHHGTTKDRDYLHTIYSRMQKQSITFHDILNESKTGIKQYRTVLACIQTAFPEFIPENTICDESYHNHLLDKLKPDSAICKSPAENLLSLAELRDKFKIQIANEMEGSVEIKSVEKFDTTKPIVSFYKKIIVDLENEWKTVISEAFDRDLKALKNREYRPIPNAMVLYPCLCVLDKNEYVEVILREVRKLAAGSETYSAFFSSLCRKLGKYVNDRYEILENKRNGYIDVTTKVYEKYSDWYINRKNTMNSRIIWQRISNDVSPDFSLDLQNLQWPSNLQLAVGKFLYGIILKDIKIDANYIRPGANTKHLLPAFYTLFRANSAKHMVEEIKPHPILSKIYRESQPETLDFDTALVPSVCPPRPWSSVRSGGFLLCKTDVIRVPLYAAQQLKRLESVPPSQMWPSLDSLNQLSSIPWTVNTVIADLAIKIFRDGGSAKLNVPQPPSVLAPVPLLRTDSSETVRKSITKARMELKRKKAEMYSLWCDALYRLSLANHFRNKIFWLPHNMDFRGRVYPIPPHLNHLGSDLARSMLIFALGKPLGPNGLDWLKIHTINLTGLKKRDSIKERLRYANEILDKILDSAKNPLTGEMWWTTSDEPWQTLAACMEIAAALKTPNPEEYICRFPIHQDGSCNGLQHYAALGRDQIGAINVNLAPSEIPQDVYSSVATMVEECRQVDAMRGDEVAKALEGHVKRKVIKQTVMTTVYGVTKFGARLQIARQLKDIENFPQEYVWPASLYLTRKTFDSLGSMFESARYIQEWFTDCARIISTLKGQNIEWVTPLGLPVIQPYSKINPSKSGYHDVYTDILEKPNTVKQKNAFAPNFVHSLDSCHMMLTSLYCENKGLTFVSVHDCYWTHPSTVEIMNKICREQFVALHSEPILSNLSKFFVEKYALNHENSNDDSNLATSLEQRKIYHTITQVPQTGMFDLNGVLSSTYFFS